MEVGQVQKVQWNDRCSRDNFTITEVEVDCRTMGEEVLAGLRGIPKAISPKYLYDEEGSRLFDQICELPEYYPTRTELSTGLMQRRWLGTTTQESNG